MHIMHITVSIALASQQELAIATDLNTWIPGTEAPTPSPTIKSQSAANRRRQVCRQKVKQRYGHPPTQSTIDTIIHEAAPQHISFGTASLPHVRSAFTAKCQRFATERLKQEHAAEMRRERRLEELISQGFQYIRWEGHSTYLVDCNNIVFGVIASPPSGPDYCDTAGRVFGKVMKLSERLLPASVHRRGNFPVINFGIHHGLGLKAPVNLQLNKRDKGIAEELTEDGDFQRLCTFQSGKKFCESSSRS